MLRMMLYPASVELEWTSAFNGGSEQTFTVSYRASDSIQFINKTGIPDPGYGKWVRTNVTGLKPATDYQFKVKSINLNPGDNTSPFTDIVTTRTNSIPSEIVLALSTATITTKDDFVLVICQSFQSGYSVYVEYYTKDTNQCQSTKPVKSAGADLSIRIAININPGHAYKYKLIIANIDGVIARRELHLEEANRSHSYGKQEQPSLDTLIIAGVVIGSISFVLVVVVVIVLLIKQLRNGPGRAFNNNPNRTKTEESMAVYSESTEVVDTDSRDYATASPYINTAFSEIEPDFYEDVKE
ncbi:uncharacterized protein LOC141902194 [Tubulanus polymorphus]|uniref:uncharacterized protein LOC141902194 n=1 Tax=Tubulanus polymorphus TaxID=672921 RepID=UPI003DA24DD6